MLRQRSYPIAPRGLATSFAESETPPSYALRFRNRFINAAGGAEKRPGMSQFGNAIDQSPTVSGLHELIKGDATPVLFASAIGRIYRYDDGPWTLVYTFASSARIRSEQMGDKLIFHNGVDISVLTEDGVTFREHKAVIERGSLTTGSDPNELVDSNVENWVTETQIALNDLVHNGSTGAYAIVTSIATATVGHTIMGSAGQSATGIGLVSQKSVVGDPYEITDLVELNIIPGTFEADNVADAGTGTNTTAIAVSGIDNWIGTDIKVGDYVSNTTRNAVTQVTAISSATLGVIGIASQVAGDSLVFLKPAMPRTAFGHVHFGRYYMVDDRDGRKIRISGAGNPEDMTTDAGTFDSSTFSFGDLQPEGDVALSMESHQRFIAFGGRQHIYLYEGVNPIVDVSGESQGFSLIAVFNYGILSADCMENVGNDLAFVSPDGVMSLSLQGDASTLGRINLSEALRATIRKEILREDAATIFHYQRRSWLCVKIGTKVYVYNYTPFFGQEIPTEAQFPADKRGSWSEFDGKFAQQQVYFVRHDGSLLCAGSGGKVYQFDEETPVYTDDGEEYTTEYQTGWLTMSEPTPDVKVKAGKYIRPIFDVGDNAVTYTVRVDAPFRAEAVNQRSIPTSGLSDAIGTFTIGTYKIGGTSIIDRKYSLRWRGKEARFTFTTQDDAGPDVLSRFTVYYTEHGAR